MNFADFLAAPVRVLNQKQLQRQRAAKQAKKQALRSGKLNADRLVVLRMGLGRDSMTMLVLLAQGKLVVEGKPRGPSEIDAVVFTDPGHEWQFTYDLIPRVKAFCDRYGIRFLVQSKPPKEGKKGWIGWMHHQIAERKRAKKQGRTVQTFGTPPWRENPPASIEKRCETGYYHDRIPLFDDYAAKEAWISKDDSTCTINHKIKPNRELLVDLMEERFGPQKYGILTARLPYTRQGQSWGNKVRDGMVRPHLMLIGYAADEDKRLSEARKAEGKSEGWTDDFDSEAYPLMEMGITKAGEEPYLEGLLGVGPDMKFRNGGFSDVKKSGCRSCIHQDAAQWWMLRHLDPDFFRERVAHQVSVVKRTGPWQAIFPKEVSITSRMRKIDVRCPECGAAAGERCVKVVPPKVPAKKIDVRCPECGVRAGEDCLGARGTPVKTLHVERDPSGKMVTNPAWFPGVRGEPMNEFHEARNPHGAVMENPALTAYRKEGWPITLAWRDTEYDENGNEKKVWVRVSSPKDAPKGEEVRAHVLIPVADVVERWLHKYRAEHGGRDPDWEEVARKEYRACKIGASL